MFQIEIDNHEKLRIKIVHECLDSRACAALNACADFLAKPNRKIEMDVSCVQFADSRGLELICQLGRTFERLELFGVTRRLKKCLAKLPASRIPTISQSRRNSRPSSHVARLAPHSSKSSTG